MSSTFPPWDQRLPNDDDELERWIESCFGAMDARRHNNWRYRVLGATVSQVLAKRKVAKRHLSLALPTEAYAVFMREVRATGLRPGRVLRILVRDWLRDRGAEHEWFEDATEVIR